ncbi:hypothetical protein B7494_g7916 [Chlorociboria aeruginascens]|nr:hypothetical protein B7494_g7916 [Chlorociboria aeruginascens]
MSTEQAKGCWRGLNPDEQIEAALRDGLSEDRSGIDSNPVYRKLNEKTSQPRYDAMWDFWEASDLRNMEDMKHITEAVGRSTPGRLDKKTGKATIKTNYVDIKKLLWQHNHHNYVHEGCRVDLSALLKMHCYTSARLQEICKATYKNLVCMVAWKDGKPKIKISFKRKFTKGMQDIPKKPKHPLYERLKPAPPFSANGLLFLLAIIISAGAFRDYSTIEDILAARPPPGRKYRIMDWADGISDDPVFPEMSADGSTEKTKNETAWGHQCSDWAKRAGFTGGMGLHATRREALIKVDGKCLDELRQRTDLGEQIDNLSAQITAAITEKGRQELKAQRRYVYDQRQKLINEELANYRRTQRRVYTTQCEVDDQGEWHRSYFDRVVRRMVPERDRLARTLPIAAPLRSPEGISALQDLIALRTNDSRVAYQEALRPIGGCCPVPTCGQEIKDIVVKERWKHVYRCSKDYHEKQSGFAEFCFRCSRWITSETDWEAHCQDHIDNLDVPFRCEPVTFRHAVACAGYCSGYLRKKWLPAAVRMRQFHDRTSWQKHISDCIPEYVESLDSKDSIPCLHLLCTVVLHSESDLWNHLGDIHSTHKPDARKKRQRQQEEGDDERAETSGAARTKRRRLPGKLEDEDCKVPGGQKSAPKSRSKDPLGHSFVNISAVDFDPCPADGVEMAVVSSGSSSRRSTPVGSVWDNHDDCYSTDTSLSSLSDNILEAVPQAGEDCRSPWTTPLEAATVDLLGDSEPWNFDAIADAISSPIESQEDWILSGPDTPPSYLSSIPMELVDPELRDALPSSTSSLPATADSVEDAHGSIPITTPGRIESSVIQPLCDSQPVAIDAKGGIWEAEALLAKWKRGKTTWYLVKWRGFPHEGNTWEK